MQKQQQAPQLAPYGSMAHLAVVAKVGVQKSPAIQQAPTRSVTRRNAAK
jgi:hypothetical protein